MKMKSGFPIWTSETETKTIMKDYYIELHAVGKKETTGWDGFDECCAHFSSVHKPASQKFVADMEKAIDFYWNQQKRWWLDYAVGKLFVKTGEEPISVMSPEWEYRTRASMTNPVYEEVKSH